MKYLHESKQKKNYCLTTLCHVVFVSFRVIQNKLFFPGIRVSDCITLDNIIEKKPTSVYCIKEVKVNIRNQQIN